MGPTGGAEFGLGVAPGSWQAIYSRDARFDGRFFVGAATTRVYCRNVCPVPFARPRNIVLFACAAAAEVAGYRPCKRCQPQAAPGTPAWLGTSAVVNRAFRLILEGALNDGNVEDLAERMGLGSRQLRRLFVQHLGASPLKIATTHRVHLARRLIDESKLPMTEIAFCSGFRSVREFNHAMRLSTGQSPTAMRRVAGTVRPPARTAGSAARLGGLELRLPYREPFDWARLIGFLRERAIRGVEVVKAGSYQRTIVIGGAPGILTVRPDKAGSRLVVQLEAGSYEGLAQTVERIRRIFDLGADPIRIANHLSRDPGLRAVVKRHPGLRVPGVWDGFEAAVAAVLGQRLTVAGRRGAVERLVQMFGTPMETPVRGLRYLFPQPEALVHGDLSRVGIVGASADALRRLAVCAMKRQLSFATSRSLEEAVSQVDAVSGIDESTAQYIAMRAFGEPDAFPAGEIRLRRRVAGAGRAAPAAEAIRTAEAWRPWRAYAAMHLAGEVPRGCSWLPRGGRSTSRWGGGRCGRG